MPVQIYVNFSHQCEEAVNFYADVFQTPTPEFMRFKDRPDPNYPLNEISGNLIMHTELKIEGDTVMFSDFFPGMELIIGNNLSLTVITNDKEKTRRYFDLLSDKGEVGMELQETFWSPLYGNLTDRFGISWQFSTSQS
jgi:PhnB protein